MNVTIIIAYIDILVFVNICSCILYFYNNSSKLLYLTEENYWTSKRDFYF